MRGFLAKITKGGKKDKRKSTRMGADFSGSEGASSTTSLPRSVLHIGVGGGNDREGRGTDVEGREVSQKNLRPDVEIAIHNGTSRKGSDVDGKKPDRSVDPPHPSLSAPSTSHGGEPEGAWIGLIQLLPLIVSPDNTDNSTIPDHPQEALGPDQNEPETTGEKESRWKSTASATAKLLLRGVSESADAFGPLKSVAGFLCYILENCEVQPSSSTCYLQHLPAFQRTKANEQAIESLAPRIDALSAILCAPVSDDAKEQPRRGELKR